MSAEDREKDTLPMLENILKAINEMRQENDARFQALEERVEKMAVNVETRLEDVRLQIMSFDVRIDRLQASVHEALNIVHNVRADVPIMREELNVWSKEVQGMQKVFQD
jgi:hypothetical protein